MTKFTKLAVAALFAVAMLGTTASADVAKGQKLYSKKLKGACGVTGAKFAAKHTQDQWEEIKEAGKFGDEVKKICPKMGKGYKDKWSNDLYDFAYEYASDSGNVPSC
ncbi:MAG: cytochrome C [Campylobacterota bacterium]|nr:cytochrome C [Campylobacterota bacterium]MEA3418723.1 cytochrome C [Campylobacterota bacterium]